MKYVCVNCHEVTESPVYLTGSTVPIHVCAPDCYDIAVQVKGHDCADFQEAYWNLTTDAAASRCLVCTAVKGETHG